VLANPQLKTRIRWNFALVEVNLKPDLGKMVNFDRPSENKKSKFKIYSIIHFDAMEIDFYKEPHK